MKRNLASINATDPSTGLSTNNPLAIYLARIVRPVHPPTCALTYYLSTQHLSIYLIASQPLCVFRYSTYRATRHPRYIWISGREEVEVAKAQSVCNTKQNGRICIYMYKKNTHASIYTYILSHLNYASTQLLGSVDSRIGIQRKKHNPTIQGSINSSLSTNQQAPTTYPSINCSKCLAIYL